MKKMRGMVALCVALSVTAGASALLAQKVEQKEVKRSKAEELDIAVLLKAVDTVEAGQAAATGTTATWESHHFIRSQDGTTYVPFTVHLDRSKVTTPIVALYVRVAKRGAPPAAPSKDDKNKNPALYPWENVYFASVGADGKVSRAFQVPGGDYDVYIAVKDKGTVEKADKNYNPAVSVAKKDVSVPDFTAAELTTSSVILATAIQPVPAGLTSQEDPYVFGPMQIVPSRDGKYKKADALEVVYWIYGAAGDAAGKPDVTIENSFNQKTADGEKFFNKTQPQSLNAQSLPPDFTAKSGPLPGTLQVPLASFPPGEYRLEIKISDKAAGKTVTQNVAFTVLES